MLSYFFSWLILGSILAIAASGLKVVVDLVGLTSVTQASFVGVGAYTFASIASDDPLFLALGVTLSLAVGTLSGWLFGLLTFRSQRDLFVLISFAVQVVFSSLLLNAQYWTGGAIGISGVPKLPIISVDSGISALILVLLSLLVAWATNRLCQTPYAVILRAIREDEELAEVLGVRTTLFRAHANAIAGGCGGFAGALLASYFEYIDPSSFSIGDSIFLLSIVVVTGLERFWLVPLASITLVSFPEASRLALDIESSAGAYLRTLLYGMFLVFAVVLEASRVQKRTNPTSGVQS